MGANIVKAAPFRITILPQNQVFAKQLDGIGLVSFQVFGKCHGVPLLGPGE